MNFIDAVQAAKEGKRIRRKGSHRDFVFYDYGTFRWQHVAGGRVEVPSPDELLGEWEVEGEIESVPPPAFVEFEPPAPKSEPKPEPYDDLYNDPFFEPEPPHTSEADKQVIEEEAEAERVFRKRKK